MLRLVLDANVWVSGLLFKGGTPSTFIDMVVHREVRSFHSEPILQEVLRNVLKVSDSEDEVVIARRVIWRRSVFVEPVQVVDPITGKDSDNRILECAVEANADMIVSGDRRHLLVLEQFQGIPILSPRDAYDRIMQSRTAETP